MHVRCLLLWPILLNLYAFPEHYLDRSPMTGFVRSKQPRTDEPPCPNECTDSAHGTCINGTCVCEPEWRGSDCSVVRCPGERENCNGKGRCMSNVTPAQCLCNDGWDGDDCSIRKPSCHVFPTWPIASTDLQDNACSCMSEWLQWQWEMQRDDRSASMCVPSLLGRRRLLGEPGTEWLIRR